MFTGIVEEIGQVSQWRQDSHNCRITVSCRDVLTDTAVGDSISVNGVCLTVSLLHNASFTADVMVESLNKTALIQLGTGSKVNLERALQIGGRLGGHWVTGHIDGVGTIRSVTRERNSLWYEVEVADAVAQWLVMKGSIALDGTSLTVADFRDNICTVSLIPHTAEQTVLGEKKAGDLVNVEADILGKYVHKFMFQGKENLGSGREHSQLSLDHLRKAGFAQ